MCLNNISGAKIATRDIVCYKILKKDMYSPFKLRTFHQESTVTIGKTYRSRIEICNCSDIIYIALHSFKYKKDLKAKYKNYVFREDIVYVKCIIPKGAKYHTGIFDHCENYASNRLTYVKIIK